MFEIDFLSEFDPGKVMESMGKIWENSWKSHGKVMENMGKIWEKSWKSHGIHEQNPCMNPGLVLHLHLLSGGSNKFLEYILLRAITNCLVSDPTFFSTLLPRFIRS